VAKAAVATMIAAVVIAPTTALITMPTDTSAVIDLVAASAPKQEDVHIMRPLNRNVHHIS
jgi:hypothetical protein